MKFNYLLLLALTPWLAEAQGGKAPVEESKGEEAPETIGMEAFKEVMASGQYLVGPGDKFLVYVAGMGEPEESKVLAEGGLYIPRVGRVQVGGLRLRDARRAVQETYNREVKSGEITVELIAPRSFPVPIVGLIDRPGIVEARGVERISEVLRKAGNLRPTASRRNIRVIKTASLDAALVSRVRALAFSGEEGGLEDQESRRVDLDLYNVVGESRYNPFVEDGDIVLVGPQAGQVGVFDAVQRPDVYEFVPGDRISDMLRLAMGPATNHDPDNAFLFRYAQEVQQRVVLSVDLQGVMRGDPQADQELRQDDWIVIRSLPEYHRRSEISVVGEVVYPGYYVVEKGKTTLREVIERAGGFTEGAALAEGRVVRQKQSKQEEDFDPEYERIRTIPVADRTEEENQYFIMKSREKRGQMVVDFGALFKEGDETQNIQLLPGDVIVVPALQRTVVVSGQAAHPGVVIYQPEFTVQDYIQKAGGLGWRASKDVLVIKARTGEIKRARDVTQIEPGDRIWIKEKPVHDYWAIFTQGMGVIGQVSTIVLLYVSLTK